MPEVLPQLGHQKQCDGRRTLGNQDQEESPGEDPQFRWKVSRPVDRYARAEQPPKLDVQLQPAGVERVPDRENIHLHRYAAIQTQSAPSRSLRRLGQLSDSEINSAYARGLNKLVVLNL